MGHHTQYIVSLSQEEKNKLQAMSKDNKLSARVSKRVLILLALDDKKNSNLNHRQIASALNTTVTTIVATARDYFQNGLEHAISHHYNPSSLRPHKVNGELEAHVLQLACGEAPDGYSRWTLELLTEEVNKKGIAEPVSKETIRVMLKKNELQPHRNEYWCIPPKENAAFVACMEDILHIYELPYNENVPVICMDEKPYQLLGETREPLPLRSGDNRKTDSEYIRCGTCSIFIFTEPLADYRHVAVCEHRTRKEWAEQIRYLLTEVYPEKEKIILVMDNLNTHTKASLYQTFPPEEAYELAKRLEIHYTPKHGSWLNIAEIELNAMTRQCLDRRIDDIHKLEEELSAWESRRNMSKRSVNWHFTAEDARIKLRSLYPKFDS